MLRPLLSDLSQTKLRDRTTISHVKFGLTQGDNNSRAISMVAGLYQPKREVPASLIEPDDKSNTIFSGLATKPNIRDQPPPRFTPGFSKIVEIPAKQTKSTTSTRTPNSILNQTEKSAKEPPGHSLDPKDIRLGTSTVPHDLQDDINTFKLKFSMKNLRTYGAMTHLVVIPEVDKATKEKYVARTFKVMSAIVHSIPIVEFRWVRESVLSDRILDPTEYMVLRDRVSSKGIARSRGEVQFYHQGFRNFFEGLTFCVVRTLKHGVKFKESEIKS